MRLKRLWPIILAAGFVLQTSCIWFDFPWDFLGGSYEAEFHKTVSLKAGGTVRLDNPRGDVEIRGWDKDQVEITSRQEPPYSSGQNYYSRWSMRFAPRVIVNTTEDSVSITAPGAGRGQGSTVLHFLVYVPRSVELKEIRVADGSLIVGDVYGTLDVSLGAGDLTVENFSGSIQALVNKGSVEAEVLDLRSGDQVTITDDEGDVDLILEADAGAKLEADPGNGRFKSDFEIKAPAGSAKVAAVLGDGRAVIHLKTSHGNIRLKKAESPEEQPLPEGGRRTGGA